MRTTFGIEPSEILHISAKTGKGVQDVLEAIIDRIPAPRGLKEAPLKAFLFDSLWVKPTA
jgi:translation elongation factor EF-4